MHSERGIITSEAASANCNKNYIVKPVDFSFKLPSPTFIRPTNSNIVSSVCRMRTLKYRKLRPSKIHIIISTIPL